MLSKLWGVYLSFGKVPLQKDLGKLYLHVVQIGNIFRMCPTNIVFTFLNMAKEFLKWNILS